MVRPVDPPFACPFACKGHSRDPRAPHEPPLGLVERRYDAPGEPAQALRTHAGFRSDVGPHMASNEDRCYVDPKARLFLVVDGMGGHPGGEIASEILIRSLPETIRQRMTAGGPNPDVRQIIGEAVAEGRRALTAVAERYPSFRRMGATMALALIANDELHVAYHGDCRVYLERRGKIRRLTKDHSYVQVLLDAGAISAEEARVHPRRNLVIDCLKACDPEPDRASAVLTFPLRAGDRLLLCTDGLWGVVDDERLHGIMRHTADALDVVRLLVDAAIDGGSTDNITCVAVDIFST